jgi:MtN3 and saliva related transmembrane protein
LGSLQLTELIGTLAALLTTISFIPQVAKVLVERRTDGLSTGMYVLFTLGVLLWMIYGILISSIPTVAANVVTFILAASVLGMKLHLDHSTRNSRDV